MITTSIMNNFLDNNSTLYTTDINYLIEISSIETKDDNKYSLVNTVIYIDDMTISNEYFRLDKTPDQGIYIVYNMNNDIIIYNTGNIIDYSNKKIYNFRGEFRSL